MEAFHSHIPWRKIFKRGKIRVNFKRKSKKITCIGPVTEEYTTKLVLQIKLQKYEANTVGPLIVSNLACMPGSPHLGFYQTCRYRTFPQLLCPKSGASYLRYPWPTSYNMVPVTKGTASCTLVAGFSCQIGKQVPLDGGAFEKDDSVEATTFL